MGTLLKTCFVPTALNSRRGPDPKTSRHSQAARDDPVVQQATASRKGGVAVTKAVKILVLPRVA